MMRNTAPAYTQVHSARGLLLLLLCSLAWLVVCGSPRALVCCCVAAVFVSLLLVRVILSLLFVFSLRRTHLVRTRSKQSTTMFNTLARRTAALASRSLLPSTTTTTTATLARMTVRLGSSTADEAPKDVVFSEEDTKKWDAFTAPPEGLYDYPSLFGEHEQKEYVRYVYKCILGLYRTIHVHSVVELWCLVQLWVQSVRWCS